MLNQMESDIEELLKTREERSWEKYLKSKKDNKEKNDFSYDSEQKVEDEWRQWAEQYYS